MKMKTFISDLSSKENPISEKVLGKTLRHSILKLIQKENPDFSLDNSLSISELNNYREKHITGFLVKEADKLTTLDKKVVSSLTDETTLTDKINSEELLILTAGQRIADKVASFGGSWTFIISFGIFLLLWISLNVFWFANKGFDPYPFILLNLILSSLAAIQAPVIMMSQNRQEEKDRERAKKDYMINLKSELEIRILHEKLDHLIIKQQQELYEIHREQTEMLNDILKKVDKTKS